jgi:hypothetical protein
MCCVFTDALMAPLGRVDAAGQFVPGHWQLGWTCALVQGAVDSASTLFLALAPSDHAQHSCASRITNLHRFPSATWGVAGK